MVGQPPSLPGPHTHKWIVITKSASCDSEFQSNKSSGKMRTCSMFLVNFYKTLTNEVYEQTWQGDIKANSWRPEVYLKAQIGLRKKMCVRRQGQNPLPLCCGFFRLYFTIITKHVRLMYIKWCALKKLSIYRCYLVVFINLNLIFITL